MFGFAGSLAHGEDGGSGRDGIGNADESFLRNVAAASAGKRKNAGAHKREAQAKPVSAAPMRIHPDQDGGGSA